MAEKLYAVVVQRDDTVRVASVAVVKETPQFYFIEKRNTELRWEDPAREDRAAFGYSDRIPKDNAFTSAPAALAHYMARRQRDKENARAVLAQATKQIASANELLMQCRSDG